MTTDDTSDNTRGGLALRSSNVRSLGGGADAKGSTTNLRITLPIPFYIGRLPTYNWASISIVLVSP